MPMGQVATQKPCPPANELVDQVETILRGESVPGRAADRSDAEPLPEITHAEVLVEDSDEELTSIFLDEGHEIHDAISECLDQWREDPLAMDGVAQLQQELHTLKGGARLSDLDPIAELADGWLGALDSLLSSPGNQKLLLALSDRGLADLTSMLSALEQSIEPAADLELLAAFNSIQDPDGVSGALSEEQTAAADQEMVGKGLAKRGAIGLHMVFRFGHDNRVNKDAGDMDIPRR